MRGVPIHGAGVWPRGLVGRAAFFAALLATVSLACPAQSVPGAEKSPGASSDLRSPSQGVNPPMLQGYDPLRAKGNKPPQTRNPRTGTAKDVLLEMAQSEDPATRLAGLEGLAQVGRDQNVVLFVAALADPDPRIHAVAEQALAACGGPAVFEAIMGLLERQGLEHSARVLDALPALRTTLEPRLIAALESADVASSRRQLAAHCLGWMGSVAAIPALARGAWASDTLLALASATALTALQDPMTIPTLVGLAKHAVPEVRYAGVNGLAAMGGPGALDGLGRIAATAKHDVDLCKYALSRLGARKDEAAIPILIEVMRQHDAVRRSAAQALCSITGEDLGDNPEEWVAWYQERLTAARTPPPDQPEEPLPFDLELVQ